MSSAIERKEYSKLLDKESNICIIAPKGYGKTILLRSYAYSKKNTMYFDLEKIPISPEMFAIDFIGKIIFWDSAAKQEDFEKYQNIDFLLDLKLPKQSSEILKKVHNELLKIKPDQKLLLELAFSFPETFSKEKNKPIKIILDEFHELLNFNNFPQISDFQTEFFSIIKNQKTNYILSSSAQHLTKRIVKDNIKVINIKAFDAKEIEQLAKKLNKTIKKSDLDKILKISEGIPLIAAELITDQSSSTSVEDNLSSLLVYKHSSVYTYCNTLYTKSLNRARGATLLKSILKAMSRNPDLRLTEIARLIYRPGPVTKALLERLIEVDLVSKQDNRYTFSSNLLKRWCRFMFSEVEFAEKPNKSQISQLGESK